MTDQEALELIHAIAGKQLADPTPPEPPVLSPTGRQPKLIWTPALQRAYNHMKADADAGEPTLGAAIYNLVIANSHGNRYGDHGLWGGLAYQMTGDVAHARNAWSKVQPFISSSYRYDANNFREYGQERVLLLDWLWPALSDDERTAFFVALDREIAAGTTNPSLKPEMPVRIGDSDQVTGTYFTIATYAAAFGEVHPNAMTCFNKPYVGGYTATGTDWTTLRNAIGDWAANYAAGGEWVESTEYNTGTMHLVAMGWQALQTALGVDHFPEIAALMTHAAARTAHTLTSDRTQPLQWGDNQDAHTVYPEDHTSLAMCFDDPFARQTVYELWTQYGKRTLELHQKGKLFFDPYGSCAPLADIPPVFDCLTGVGWYVARTGWEADASVLAVHVMPTHNKVAGTSQVVDHTPSVWGDVQLYRQGHWGLTHPITYGGPSVTIGDGINGVMLSGFARPQEWGGSTRACRGEGWEFVGGTCGGGVQNWSAWRNPPVYWMECSRQILWLQGEAVDTLIICDRTDVLDPEILPNFAYYSAANQKKITTNPLRCWRWHMPVVPTCQARSAEWAIPDSAEHARITWLRDDLTTTIVDEKVAWASVPMHASERKYHLAQTPPDQPGMDVSVVVIEMGERSRFGTLAPIAVPGRRRPSGWDDPHDPREPESDVCGVSIAAPGQPLKVALFHTLPGAPLGNPTKEGWHPDNPARLISRRLRTASVAYTPPAGAWVWWPETAQGVAMTVT